jgi:hypothetical protein
MMRSLGTASATGSALGVSLTGHFKFKFTRPSCFQASYCPVREIYSSGDDESHIHGQIAVGTRYRFNPSP